MIQAYPTPVVFATLKLFPQAKHSAQMVSILSSARDLTQTRAECLGCWLDDGGFFHGPISYVEQWESEEALRNHLQSDLYGRILVAMELSAEPPQVHFHTVSRACGIELIEEMRSARIEEATHGD